MAKLYGITAVPEMILVDGDTGLILGEGFAIRGENLDGAIKKALATKKNNVTSLGTPSA